MVDDRSIRPSRPKLVRALRGLVARLRRDRRGNVLLLFGLGLVPLTFATGMGVDYSRAMRLQTKLNAAADAAALAAVAQSMMNQSSTLACAAAKNMFVTEATGQSGLVINTNDTTQLSITMKDSSTPTASSTSTCSTSSTATTASYSRTATVHYVAKSTNAFAGILGMPTLTISGSSQANSAIAPNIDFYLVLDTSPSMAIAATQAGINTMVANTSQQSGCAFACHQSNPNSSDNEGNPTSNGKIIDNYQLARNLGVTLRTDLVTAAAANLMTVASQTELTNGAVYRMSVSTIDVAFNTVLAKTTDLTAAQTAASKVAMLEVYDENNLTSSNSNSDTDTNFTAMTTGLTKILTPVGDGLKGDNPEGVIFIVTDGVRDEASTALSSKRWIGELERPKSIYPYSIKTSDMPTALDPTVCETYKTAGYRIAIVYTSYLPLPTNSFYNTYVSPWQPQISNNLQTCASPGLFYEVQTGGDISAALSSLFEKAVATAHLTQ